MLIFRRTNCVITASGIVILCKRPYSMPVDSGLQSIYWGKVRVGLIAYVNWVVTN